MDLDTLVANLEAIEQERDWSMRREWYVQDVTEFWSAPLRPSKRRVVVTALEPRSSAGAARDPFVVGTLEMDGGHALSLDPLYDARFSHVAAVKRALEMGEVTR